MYTRLTKVMILIMLLWLSASGVVHAGSTNNTVELGLDDPPNIGNIVTVIVVLILIIGLIILLIRFLAHKNNSWFSSRSIRHLGGVGLGQNKSVQMVKIGNSLYVVGVGEDVRLLEKIDEQSEIDAIFQTMNAAPTLSGKGLVSYLNRALNSRKQKQVHSNDDVSTPASSFQEIFHSKMQQVTDRRQQLKSLIEENNKTDGNKS